MREQQEEPTEGPEAGGLGPGVRRAGGGAGGVWLKPVDQMDLWLDSEGYYRKHTAKDGSCLFRAVAEQIFLTQAFHVELRRQIIDYMVRNKDDFQKYMACPLMEYAEKMYSPQEWGGRLEIEAMSRMYKLDFLMFEELEVEPVNVTSHGFRRQLMLCNSPDSHYDPVYTKEYITTAAFCQSTIYDLLYKRVFNLKEVDYAVNKMLHDKNSRCQREHIPFLSSGFALRLEMRESYLNVKELLDLGITPFPYKVAKSLDIDIYRNVEYDTWNEYRKGLRYGYCAWTCQEIQVGAKCRVKYEDKIFHGHVQEMQPNKGPVVIFVEELGEMRTVPYNTLELMQPSSPSKPTLASNQLRVHPLHLIDLRHGKKAVKNLVGRLKTVRDVELNLRNVKQCRNGTEEECPPEQSYVITSTEFPEQEINYQGGYNEYSTQHYQIAQTEEKVCHEPGKQDTVSGLTTIGYEVYPETVTGPPTTLNLPLPTHHPHQPQQEISYTQQPLQVNFMAPRSLKTDGSDLPHTDDSELTTYERIFPLSQQIAPPRKCLLIPSRLLSSDPRETDVQTLRFFYNLGLDHLRMNYGLQGGGGSYYIGAGPLQSGYIALESPTLAPYETFTYPTLPGGKRPTTFQGATLIQQNEVSSSTGGAPQVQQQHQQQQTAALGSAVALPEQHQLTYYQPLTPTQDSGPPPEAAPPPADPYCLSYAVDYSYDYPIYQPPTPTLLPQSSYLGPDGLIYQAVLAPPPHTLLHPLPPPSSI